MTFVLKNGLIIVGLVVVIVGAGLMGRGTEGAFLGVVTGAALIIFGAVVRAKGSGDAR